MKCKKFSPTPQAGFTLVEIMVGLVIGMLATIIIMQVLSVFEAQKRTTTGSADAQTNGNIALYDVQRDLQLAGYALFPYGQAGTPDSPLECSTAGMTYGTTGITSIAPVTIVEGGAQGSDSITIRYGNSLNGGVPTLITAAPTTSITVAPPAQDVPVTSSQLCKANDIALIINGNKCSITKVPASGVPNATTVTIENNTPITNGAAVTGASLACLGSWNTVTYAVNNGNLERNGVPILPGIVNLQAQYGISATGVASSSANYNQIVQWVDASGGTWGAPSRYRPQPHQGRPHRGHRAQCKNGPCCRHDRMQFKNDCRTYRPVCMGCHLSQSPHCIARPSSRPERKRPELGELSLSRLRHHRSLAQRDLVQRYVMNTLSKPIPGGHANAVWCCFSRSSPCSPCRSQR